MALELKRVTELKKATPVYRMSVALEFIELMLQAKDISDDKKDMALTIGQILEPSAVWIIK